MADWYRRKTWTKIDEEEFFIKLNRARVSSRAQYLKVQAIELVETKRTDLLLVAETLLNRVLTEYPNDRIEISPVLNTLGHIYKLRGVTETALDLYKQSLDYEKVFPNVITTSYLDFSELVVKMNKSDLYEFTRDLIEERLAEVLFPVAKYKICSVLSIIYAKDGDTEKAKHYGDLSIQYQSVSRSGLRYHRYLGLVSKSDAWLSDLVKQNLKIIK